MVMLEREGRPPEQNVAVHVRFPLSRRDRNLPGAGSP